MNRSSVIAMGAVGALGGALLLYPYAVFVNRLVHVHEDGHVHLHWFDLGPTAVHLFALRMIPLALPFAIIGLAMGLLVALAMRWTRKLAQMQQVASVQRHSNEAMEKFAVSVAHHVLNANMVIASRARACQMHAGAELSEHLDVILQEAAAIDSVVTALRYSAQRHRVAQDWEHIAAVCGTEREP